MNRLFSLGILVFIIVFSSCEKDGNRMPSNDFTIRGTWNASFIKRFDRNGTLIREEALDTISISKMSIYGGIAQSLHIDTLHSFYFLMYSSYEYENGVFRTRPDSLLDINMNMYYWTAADSSFGSFPILAYPFESTIEQFDSESFIENRSREGIGSIEIWYNRISTDYIDLSEEFIAYGRSLQNTRIIKHSNSNIQNSTPVYNACGIVSRH